MSNQVIFTPREKIIVKSVCKGDSLKQISVDLNISYNYLRTRLGLIYKKVKVKNKNELIYKISLNKINSNLYL